MTAGVRAPERPPPAQALDISAAAVLPGREVVARLGSAPSGLSGQEVLRRTAAWGPNAVRAHHARLWPLLLRQLRSPLLVLLAVTAAASFGLGQRTDAIIIGVILTASVGLGLGNEYRAERAAEALHDRMRHECLVWREGSLTRVDVTTLVPGDVVDLRLGEVVPADLRLLATTGLECDESVLTGEAQAVEKSPEPVTAPSPPLAELTSCALMGTVVHAGKGRGVVVATGGRAEFGRIALGLGERQPETEFQVGLRTFSLLLMQVAGALTVGIFVINVALHRPVIDALLFSLAIAVGISPQLLPAVVSTSLAAGSRALARRKVLVKRLVCIEDLGDIEVLFTDKTGTLTDGRISYMRARAPDGTPDSTPLRLGLLCTETGNPLDDALLASPPARSLPPAGARTIATLPFDHDRRRVSVLVDLPDEGRLLIVKGAPEGVLDLCPGVPASARRVLEEEFAAAHRVVAVASRPVPGLAALTAAEETGLTLAGLLIFLDPPKDGAADALARLAELGITVKVITGDNPVVAARLGAELGLPEGGVLTGVDLAGLDEAALAEVIPQTAVFARVSPEDKARIVRAQRRAGADVAFLGDGVNDALALHAADVGISVDSATDVAKDAADIILLEKDLHVLADGVVEGRRIFANTMKYVLMGTSSNFGNMFSAAGASAFLSFLPMLPSQILLNNLLYDSSQLAIPTDRADPEQLLRPAHWDVAQIRRFMLFFGPISSIFDFITFGVMLWGFDAGPSLFRSGWFVESLATQTLVIFVIRTRRVPFFRSTPSLALTLAALGAVLVGAVLPETPLAGPLGFTPLPGWFFVALIGMALAYLALVEAGKRLFFRPPAVAAVPAKRPRPGRRTHRRAARFSTSAH